MHFQTHPAITEKQKKVVNQYCCAAIQLPNPFHAPPVLPCSKADQEQENTGAIYRNYPLSSNHTLEDFIQNHYLYVQSVSSFHCHPPRSTIV